MSGCGAELLGWTEEALAELERLRGWTEEAIERLELGWDERSGRVGIPIRDATGDQLGTLHYLPDPARRNRRPQMQQPAGVPRQLFPPPEMIGDDELAVGRLLLTEGESDCVAAWSAGLAAVAVPGTNGWKPEYAARLSGRRWTVCVCFDCDAEGRKAAEKVAASLVEAGVDARLVDLDEGHEDGYDLTDFLRERGADALGELLAEAKRYDATVAAAPTQPFALSLDEFIAARSDLPPILIGHPDEVILPRAGFLQLVGRGGRGKTTCTVDAAFHLASGLDWLELPVERPLRILFIENEGPQEMFRTKLEAKREHWPHEIAGAIFVYTQSWGAFTLAEPEAVERLRSFIAEQQIDLVIGDPLNTLGASGVGTPEDTQKFVVLLADAGLGRDVAFWLLHHPRKERTDDELDEASGAWGGKPDAMLRIDVQPGDRARLSFPKVRWSRRSRRPALILAFDPATEAYTVVGEEGEERDLVAELGELLADGKWRIVKEIAAKKEADPPGIGVNEKTVKQVLEENPERFESRTGDEAAELGRRRDAVVWQKRSQAPNAADSDPASQGRRSESGVQRQASIDAERSAAALRHTEAASAAPAPLANDEVDEAEVERLAELARDLQEQIPATEEGA